MRTRICDSLQHEICTVDLICNNKHLYLQKMTSASTIMQQRFLKSVLNSVPVTAAKFLMKKTQYILGCQTGSQDKLKPCQNCSEQQLKNKRPTWCHLLFYFTSYVLNMFRTLIYPSPGACDCVVELPHWSSCSRFVVCWRFGAAGFEWCPCCRLQPATRTPSSWWWIY